MSRLRVSLSSSDVDKEIARCVDAAERSLQSALRVCVAAQEREPAKRSRIAAVRRDIHRAIGAMAAIHRVAPRYDTTDPDLTELPPKPREPRVAPKAPPVAVVNKSRE